MGTDIHIYREILTDDGWKCCEKKNSKGEFIPIDFPRMYSFFSLLSGVRREGDDDICVNSSSSGLPDDSIDLNYLNGINDVTGCFGLSFIMWKDLDEFYLNWGYNVRLTGYLPPVFMNYAGEQLLDFFERGVFKDDIYKKSEILSKIYNECNVLKDGMELINEYPSELPFLEMSNDKKRIVFWYDC